MNALLWYKFLQQFNSQSLNSVHDFLLKIFFSIPLGWRTDFNSLLHLSLLIHSVSQSAGQSVSQLVFIIVYLWPFFYLLAVFFCFPLAYVQQGGPNNVIYCRAAVKLGKKTSCSLQHSLQIRLVSCRWEVRVVTSSPPFRGCTYFPVS